MRRPSRKSGGVEDADLQTTPVVDRSGALATDFTRGAVCNSVCSFNPRAWVSFVRLIFNISLTSPVLAVILTLGHHSL